jgi:hypothetical protein
MMDDDAAFVSLAEFARLHGVSKPTVTNWKRRGYIVLTNGKVDVSASNQRLADRPTGVVGGQPRILPGKPIEPPGAEVSELGGSNPANWSRQEALRQREIAQARLAQIEADRAAGLVVPIAEVEGVVRGEYSICRTVLLGIASKIAHRLAAATTPEACGSLVDVEVRAALEALTADAPK